MKNFTLKSIFVSLFLLPATQVSAQENSGTVEESLEELSCNPFPRCKGVGDASKKTNNDDESQWLQLLWEKLTKEIEDKTKIAAPEVK